MTHLLPALDWLVKLGAGVIVAAAGVLLIRRPRLGGMRFAVAICVIEVGTLIAIRGIVAGGASTRWQYLMPFALVLVPALFVVVVVIRLGWWSRIGFTRPSEWRGAHLLVPLSLVLALPVAGLSARGVLVMPVVVLWLQVAFMLIDVVMEELTYRGLILEALVRYPVLGRVFLSAVLFGLSHLDNLFLPGADELGVAYQIFEAVLIGVLFAACRIRMNTIWPVIAVHAVYDFMLVLAFGHAFPVAPNGPGFVVDTFVNLALAGMGVFLLRDTIRQQPARLRLAA